MRSQAEIAGGAWNASEGFPRKGQRIPDFELPDATGTNVSTADFRGRANLMLAFVGDVATSIWLHELGRHDPELSEQNAELLIVAPSAGQIAGGKRTHVLIDNANAVRNRFAASADALYITDCFGEVFSVFRTGEEHGLANPDDVLQWLEFINGQCPECGTPEWPI